MFCGWRLLPLGSLLLLLLGVCQPGYSAKILGFLAIPSATQFAIHDTLLRELANRGHQVTVVGLQDPSVSRSYILPPNYRYIHAKPVNVDAINMDKWLSTLMRSYNNDPITEFAFETVPNSLGSFLNITSAAIRHPLVEKLKRDEQFDLILFGWFFNDFQLGLAAHFRCPSILLSTVPPIKILRDYVGNPSMMAITPSPFSPYVEQMSFGERVINFFLHHAEAIVTAAVQQFIWMPQYEQLFPSAKGYPSLEQTQRNVSMVLMNQHFSERMPMASFPAMVEVGGLNVNFDYEPLSTDYQRFLDEATDGAILFSLGIDIEMSTYLTQEKLETFIAFFATLKQRIIMKWELDERPLVAQLPQNVRTGKWLPQQAILAHPNTVLFMSACGTHSISEARMHGVPVLGMPVLSQQHLNLKDALDEGWAMPFSTVFMNEAALKFAFNETFTNPRFRKNVQALAVGNADRPEAPLQLAVYWVEYVLRHKGAAHLQSQAVHLNWIQSNSLNVYGAMALVFFVVWLMVKRVIRWSCRILMRRNEVKVKTVAKRNKRVKAD